MDTPHFGDQKTDAAVKERACVQFCRNGVSGSTRIEAVMLSDGSIRFQETDGWELVPYDIVPHDDDMRIALHLLERRMEVNLNRHAHWTSNEIDDEDIGCSLASEPKACSIRFATLERLAEHAVSKAAQSGRVFELLDRYRDLDHVGHALIGEYQHVAQALREWMARVDELDSDLVQHVVAKDDILPTETLTQI